jgi:superfamily II DNA/RNA helicase
MGVNAHSLDLLVADKGRSHLLYGPGTGEDNPTLLVSTLATTRGLDLPELTHVFILGIPGGPKVTGRTVDAYVHVAGRVGRFGRDGKVITVVEKDEDIDDGPTTESSKMGRILNAIQITPVQFEHFD